MALLLGSMGADQTLTFAGKVGTGFDAKMRKRLFRLLKSDELEKTTAHWAPRLRAAHWVEPKHVAALRFSEWTRDGKLRHPSFQGLREDKAPAHDVPTSHPEKVIFPKLKYTKVDVREYLDAVALAMLPALEGRPLSFQQFSKGIGGPSFFRHNATTSPQWVTKALVQHAEKPVEHLIVDKPETLSWLANQSALTLHMPSSRMGGLDSPDWVHSILTLSKAASSR